jgi:hypothetical protein
MESKKNKRPPVIVRGWGGEPVVLYLHRIENNRCYVGQPHTVKPIGLPVNQVFAFDSQLFSTLSTAYSTQDAAGLERLYGTIRLDDFACNRYQDNVPSLHDKEDFTNSECDAGGDRE